MNIKKKLLKTRGESFGNTFVLHTEDEIKKKYKSPFRHQSFFQSFIGKKNHLFHISYPPIFSMKKEYILPLKQHI